ncbi:MAG TPA: ABC transporter permease [Actinomycetes bacterium]
MASAADARALAQTRVRWELLANLVRKDLKVKYKNSALGFAWSLANPLLYLAVFSIVFSAFLLRGGVPHFAVYLMSGLLVWNFFATGVMGATGAVTGSSNLVKKVRFPRIVLPLASVGFAAVHFVLQLGVLFAVLPLIYRDAFGPQLWLLLPALAVVVAFTVGMSLLASSLNVRYRDVEHLLEVALLAWFWLTPIVYPLALVRSRLDPRGLFWVFMANPMASVVAAMQRAVYRYANPLVKGTPVPVLADGGYAFYLRWLGIAGAVSLVLIAAGLVTFRRLEADFAEEL